jgi:hypothetical protein
LADKKGGKEKAPDKKKETTEPECCAVVVVKMGGKGKTVVPLKTEGGDIKIGDKTLRIQCECD